MGAKQGEKCGHCGTAMQAGYTACTGCGATRKELRPFWAWLVLLIVGSVAVGASEVLLEYSGRGMQGVGIVVSIIVAFLVFKLIPKKITYLR